MWAGMQVYSESFAASKVSCCGCVASDKSSGILTHAGGNSTQRGELLSAHHDSIQLPNSLLLSWLLPLYLASLRPLISTLGLPFDPPASSIQFHLATNPLIDDLIPDLTTAVTPNVYGV